MFFIVVPVVIGLLLLPAGVYGVLVLVGLKTWRERVRVVIWGIVLLVLSWVFGAIIHFSGDKLMGIVFLLMGICNLLLLRFGRRLDRGEWAFVALSVAFCYVAGGLLLFLVHPGWQLFTVLLWVYFLVLFLHPFFRPPVINRWGNALIARIRKR